jgi:hypothetical protein
MKNTLNTLKYLIFLVLPFLAGCLGGGSQPTVMATNGVAVPTPVTTGPQNGYRYVNGQWVQAPPAQGMVFRPATGGTPTRVGGKAFCQSILTGIGAGGGAIAAEKHRIVGAALGGVAGFLVGEVFCPAENGEVITNAQGKVERVILKESVCRINGEVFVGLKDETCFRLGDALAKKETKQGCGRVTKDARGNDVFTPDGRVMVKIVDPTHHQNGITVCFTEEQLQKHKGKYERISFVAEHEVLSATEFAPYGG